MTRSLLQKQLEESLLLIAANKRIQALETENRLLRTRLDVIALRRLRVSSSTIPALLRPQAE